MRGVHRAALAMAAILAALSLVAWRQGQAFEVRRDLEEARTEVSMARSEQHALEADIRRMSSREHIVRAARERLGLRQPTGRVHVISLEEGR